MTYGIRVDRFSSLDDIPKRDRSKPDVLLKFFQESGVRRVSTFEMTQPIYNALKALETDGHLKLLDTPYPWIGFQLGKSEKPP